jgi:hypothetical protein
MLEEDHIFIYNPHLLNNFSFFNFTKVLVIHEKKKKKDSIAHRSMNL